MEAPPIELAREKSALSTTPVESIRNDASEHLNFFNLSALPTGAYLNQYDEVLKRVFGRAGPNAHERRFTREEWGELWAAGACLTAIPKEYGGREANMRESLSVAALTARHSLPVALANGVSGGLFLHPVMHHAEDSVREAVAKDFLTRNVLGGIALTEPEAGVAIPNMKTSFRQKDNAYKIQGTKHWQSFTGEFDWVLIGAREELEGGTGIPVELFVHDMRNGGVTTEELFPTAGFAQIPYGRNRIDVSVPLSHKLQPPGGDSRLLLLDTLNRTRMHFPAVLDGAFAQMMPEAFEHARTRRMGMKTIGDFDQVQHRLAVMEAQHTCVQALCNHIANEADLNSDFSDQSILANTAKCVSSDFAFDASDSLRKLMGAKGYDRRNLAARMFEDTRVFQTFEGPNDLLYDQTAIEVLRDMQREKVSKLHDFLSKHVLTYGIADRYQSLTGFTMDTKQMREPGFQRKRVRLAQFLMQMITAQTVLELQVSGFDEKLCLNAIKFLDESMHRQMQEFHSPADLKPLGTIDSWMD